MEGQLSKKGNGEIIASYSYTLDNSGNHIQENINQPLSCIPELDFGTIDYSYNNSNQIESAGSANYDFDNNGDIEGGNSYSYSFNEYGKLSSISGDLDADFEYDGLGNRRKRNSTRFVLDVLGMSKVLAETNEGGTIQNYYIYGLGLISRINASTNTSNYYVYDFRGSTVAITDDSEEATITHSYAYNDFGTCIKEIELDYNPFRYVGLYGVMFEDENHYFMRARYYDCNTGRFISEDPVWSTNLYPYANNNPVMNVDPNGEAAETVLDVLSAGYSAYEFGNDPSLINAGFLAWDLAATVIPFVPGSYVARGGKLISKYGDDIVESATKTVSKKRPEIEKIRNSKIKSWGDTQEIVNATIYVIVDNKQKVQYVGKTVNDIQVRMKQHLRVGKNWTYNTIMAIDNVIGSSIDIAKREQFWIDNYGGLNKLENKINAYIK
jgi:RHS repeat-associated protein